MRYFGIILFIGCIALVSVVYAGCGGDTNPYNDTPGTLPNGYYPPDVNFTGDPVQGPAPLTIRFTDRSTNIPTYWAWNFGDEQTSNSNNPVHTYQSSGMYTVSLTTGNGYGGNSITKTDYVVVHPASSTPVVDFSANVTSGTLPFQVEFTDHTNGVMIISRTWEFDNNEIPVQEISPGEKITHTFTKAGLYNVTLTVTAENNESASLEKSSYIHVRDPPVDHGTVTLMPGWNLVSTPLPLNAQYQTAGEVFSGIDSGSRSIFSYDARSKHYASLSSESIISPLEGIWIYSTNETPLTFNYQVTRPITIPMYLSIGWNLVGYPSVVPGNAHEGFVSVDSAWSTILCFNPDTQQYSSTIFNERAGGTSDQQMMSPLNGYWLFMTSEGNLSVTAE